MNNWLYAVMTIFAKPFNICSPKFGGNCTFRPTWLQQWLMTMWFWFFCCNCKPIDSSGWPRKDILGMVSEICNRQQKAYLTGYIIIIVSRARRPSARRALSQPGSREPAWFIRVAKLCLYQGRQTLLSAVRISY